MPGPLQHSPADVLRQLIVDQGWSVDYVDDDTSWAAFASGEPDLPDDCVTVYDTTGVDYGRVGVTGERQESHGFQVRVRSKTHAGAYAKVRQIAVGFDEDVYLATVNLDGVAYRVQSVKRNGDPLFIGKDGSRSKRSLFTLNGVVSLREVDEIAGDRVLQESDGYIILE